MGISPIYAIPKVLRQAGLSKDDVDIYEVRRWLDIFFSIH
jgi:acetyl-CoA acetyltransferase